MITLYAQLAGIVLALACVNALVRRAYRRREASKAVIWRTEIEAFVKREQSRILAIKFGVMVGPDRWRYRTETTCVADLGSARAIMAKGGER